MKELMMYRSLELDAILQQQQQLDVRQARRSTGLFLKLLLKKYLINPVIFLIYCQVFIVLPRPLLVVMSKNRISDKMRKISIRALDLLGAIFGLLISLPVFLMVPLLIKLDSKGPVFYRQLRTGINRRKRDRRVAQIGIGNDRRHSDRRHHNLYGKPFYIVKFRTMYHDAEDASGPVWARQDDPRVTPTGRWLRKYHIDEIPQFWNILKGEMSLVGPRPERPEIIKNIIHQIPEYEKRLRAKPGLTGPAQVFLGYDSCMDDVIRKIKFDMIYISNPRVRMQLLFLVLTFLKIICNSTAVEINLFNLNLILRENYDSVPTRSL